MRLPKWYALMRFNGPEQIMASLKDQNTRETLIAEAGHDAPVEQPGVAAGGQRG